MRFRTVLFDLDGTLIDHFQAIFRCHCFAMKQVGLPEPTYQQVFEAIGGGLDQAIAKLAGAQNVEKILPIYIQHWNETNLQDAKLLPGAKDILIRLRATGARTAVLTNKRGDAARAVCAHLGLTPLVDGIFGANDTPWIKPDTRFVQHALTTLGANPEAAALVGDSPWDLFAAQNSGLAFFGVTTGTHSATQLRADGAEHVFADLDEIARAMDLS